jgi:hypothetical protein
MRPARTLVVGIISFALGIVVATRLPLVAAGDQQPAQQAPPVVVTKGSNGLTFESRTKNHLLIVGIGEPQQPQTRFSVETGQRVTLPTTKSAYMVYEVSRMFRWQPDELGPCMPDCPPPPCPGCPPWRVSGVWQVNPGIK